MKKPKSTGPASGVQDQAGRNPLHLAVIDRDRAGFKTHLGNPEYLNARDAGGWTPLHYAAQNQDLDFVQALAEAGAEIDPLDENGNTPLSNAVFSFQDGSLDLIPFLLDRGADPQKGERLRDQPLGVSPEHSQYLCESVFQPIPRRTLDPGSSRGLSLRTDNRPLGRSL